MKKPVFTGITEQATRHGPCRDPRRYYTNKKIWEEENPWGQVFEGVEPSSSRLLSSSSPKNKDSYPNRRFTMTAREVTAFDEMFNMIFNSIMETKDQGHRDQVTTAGVGKSHSSGVDDLAKKLRQHSRNLKWTSEADQELDRKKEEMDLCDTDQQLLDWAMREVFGESQRYEEAVRKATSIPSTQLQPPSYPYLIANLMRTFRDKYGDPYLALSIFDHARHLSIVSYVFGCTTPAYNELIETRWRCFRDVRGVCDALEEMKVNGIGMDTRTRALAEMVRKEVGERNVWEEESSLNSREVWNIVGRIERLIVEPKPNAPHREASNKREKLLKARTESWKKDSSNDGWEFGKWDDSPSKTESLSRGQVA